MESTNSNDGYRNDSEQQSMTTLPETNYQCVDQVTLEIREENEIPINDKPTISLAKRSISEGIGMFFFIFIALGTVNQTVLGALIGKYEVSQLTIAFGFAIGLGVGVHLCGPISGGHLNPAISFTMSLFKKLPWIDFMWYSFAQLIGAFFASLLIFCIYYDSITLFPYSQTTAGLYGTLKQSQTSIGIGLLEQIIGTALLMFGILLSVRDNPDKPNIWMIGSVLGALAIFLGSNGFAFNMARDLGPRMMSAMFWGVDVFYYENYWWWVPIVGSFIGAPLGHLLFSYVDTI